MPDELNMTKGEKLKFLREERLDITQEEAREILGIAKYSLVQIEQGKIDISDAYFDKLVEKYETEIEASRLTQTT